MRREPSRAASCDPKEYRRELIGLLTRDREKQRSWPRGYFDATSAEILMEFPDRAMNNQCATIMIELPDDAVDDALLSRWRSAAVRLCPDW